MRNHPSNEPKDSDVSAPTPGHLPVGHGAETKPVTGNVTTCCDYFSGRHLGEIIPSVELMAAEAPAKCLGWLRSTWIPDHDPFQRRSSEEVEAPLSLNLLDRDVNHRISELITKLQIHMATCDLPGRQGSRRT